MGKKEKAVAKIVLDTNVLISSLLFKGELARVVDLWKKGKIIPVLSRDTFDEFKTVLEYPKFSLTAQEMKVIIEEEVLPFFEVIEVADKIKRVCRDADDDKFITCAVSASADFIVIGDKGLDIGRYKSVKILSASGFLRMFKSE
ncbi:MAG: putative toxin-antitoxin system toxin component, PIN family [Deltaproteobacteria bacterium]|nr:putative toxin-antitoxin system toxin component, PIN family [Deltaproteobacteria bacterium]